MRYINIDVILRRKHDGPGYTIDIESPTGQPSSKFQLPFLPEELSLLHALIEGPARDIAIAPPPRVPVSEYRDRVRLFGERLYESVFDARIRASMMTSRAMARNRGYGVRIRLHLDHAPELACLPWEYLYDRDVDLHLALTTPIVRYLKLDDPPAALSVKPPLQILVMTANPIDRPRLDVDQEWGLINAALEDLQRARLVHVHRVPGGTVEDLQACLQRQDWHVFHFIGHSGCVGDDAALLLEDERGLSRPLTRADLNLALQHPTLRLAILNSCEGARPLDTDPLSGIAQGLVRSMIPAVIAMQLKISDQGAIKFAKEFYSALANNLPVDQALTEARKAMYLAKVATEWGTPVLFMRGNDGRVFDIDQRLRWRRRGPLPPDVS